MMQSDTCRGNYITKGEHAPESLAPGRQVIFSAKKDAVGSMFLSSAARTVLHGYEQNENDFMLRKKGLLEECEGALSRF